MAIFDEQVLEPFVAKGIGNSGVASRQIQATNLPDLSAAVRQSQITQQNLKDQRDATKQIINIASLKRPSSGGSSSPNVGLIGRATPVLFTSTGNGGVQIKYNAGQGIYSTKDFKTIQEANDFVKSHPALSLSEKLFAPDANASVETMDAFKSPQMRGFRAITAEELNALQASIPGVSVGGRNPYEPSSDPVKLARLGTRATPPTEEELSDARIDAQNKLATIAESNLVYKKPSISGVSTLRPTLANRVGGSVFDIGSLIGKALAKRK